MNFAQKVLSVGPFPGMALVGGAILLSQFCRPEAAGGSFLPTVEFDRDHFWDGAKFGGGGLIGFIVAGPGLAILTARADRLTKRHIGAQKLFLEKRVEDSSSLDI